MVGGIALIGTTGNGTWAYSLDGTTFTDVGTVSESSALLLPGNATLQYTPDSKNGETATITYLAWDTTSGTAGGQADLSAADATGGADGLQHRYRHRLAHRDQRERRPGPHAGQSFAG